MSEGRFQITTRQMFAVIAWVAIGFAGIHWIRVVGIEFTREAHETARLAIVWIALLASGAAFGAAVGVFAGRQLLWATIGIFAAPIAVIVWGNLKF